MIWLIVAVSLTLYYALFTQAHSQVLAAIIGRPDLVFHVAAFALMALPAFLLWQSASMVAIGMVALAGAIEILQFVFPDRDASVIDLGAGGVGIVLGVLAAMLVSNMGERHLGTASTVD